jgi:hypothetical protein
VVVGVVRSSQEGNRRSMNMQPSKDGEAIGDGKKNRRLIT